MEKTGKKETRIIKRYQNRKLYDTTDSCYVTLEDIRDLIQQGEDVQVVDNTSGADLTSVTLAQIIFEEEKKKQGLLPLSAFKEIVASGGEAIKDLFQKYWVSGVKEIHGIREFVDKQIRPTVESVQSIPTVAQEIKLLKGKIEALERKLQEYENK